MRYLLDTHLLLWAAASPEKLSSTARGLVEDPQNHLMFSAAAVWECTIKSGLRRADFAVDPRLLRRGLLENDYEELPITGAHAAAVGDLPAHHQDPFDRIQIAQARIEAVTFLTSDIALESYGSPVQLV